MYTAFMDLGFRVPRGSMYTSFVGIGFRVREV